jgi:hypothetical protein
MLRNPSVTINRDLVAPLVWRQSCCTNFINDLEVGYVGFIINAYAEA